MNYHDFLRDKSQSVRMEGFEPIWMPDFLFDFQRTLVSWAIRKGRGALLENCGLGKTPQQLVWSENVVRHTNRHVLILTPLAVGAQTVREAEKFGLTAHRSRDGKFPGSAGIVVANYESLHHFDRNDFAGVVCDDGSVLKNFDGQIKAEVTEFLRTIPYRLICTATPAPNDYVELGTLSEALGEMGYQDMITRFFKKETKKDYIGWGRLSYRMRGHAERDFWRWVCSWSRACRKPSDLGFDDGKFTIPELVIEEHQVRASRPAAGRLFDVPAENLHEQREEQRRTIPERCAKVAELMDHKLPAVSWCYLNDEADELERTIPGAKQISGTDSDEEKEETLAAFASGQILKIVTKPVIAAYGLNWQHCNHQTYFPSHSFEQFYQGVRRCWRFGQLRKVKVDIVSTDGGAKVLASLNRKADAAEKMFANMISNMNDSLRIETTPYGNQKGKVPTWLSTLKS